MKQSKPKLNIISLGMGVQSFAIYLMSSTGFIKHKADYAIFADPGAESKATYALLNWLKIWQKENNGIPIIHDKSKNLLRDILSRTNSTGQRFASIPLHTKNEDGTTGMLRRQCTSEYKISIVDKVIRELYGLKPRQRFPETEVWIGITLDEVQRMKESREKWRINKYPFLDKEFLERYYTRYDVIKWLVANNYPVPEKSACIFCPFQDDARLRERKNNMPDEWNILVQVDTTVRDSTKKGIKMPAFIHKSCKPIEAADLQEDQINAFINECEGFCGI